MKTLRQFPPERICCYYTTIIHKMVTRAMVTKPIFPIPNCLQPDGVNVQTLSILPNKKSSIKISNVCKDIGIIKI